MRVTLDIKKQCSFFWLRAIRSARIDRCCAKCFIGDAYHEVYEGTRFKDKAHVDLEITPDPRVKAYYLCVFVLVFKREDVFYSCSSKAVYALVVISDDAYIFALCTQKCDELVLNHVCVLILVNKHVFIQILIVVKDIRILFKQLYGEKYDVVKIDGVCSLKSLLIA